MTRDHYNSEFKEIERKLENHSFRDLFEEETGYQFNKARQSACPFDDCVSGKSGRKGSSGAFTYYPSLNIGKCHSCGQSAGNTKLLQILHNFSYPELIHYAGAKYFGTFLENPDVKVEVKPSERKLSEYVKPTPQEIEDEKAEMLKKFNYLKDQVLKNDSKEAALYLQNRSIDTEQLPQGSFYLLEAYKDRSAGIAFLDSEQRFLNVRYFEVKDGGNKQFSYGELLNSVYDKCFMKDHETVFITEGVINTDSLYQSGRSCIATFATTNYFNDVLKFNFYLEGKNVVIAYDFDMNFAGQKAAIKQALFVMTHFNTTSVSILMFPEDKDANDLLKDGTLVYYLDNRFNYLFPTKKQLEEWVKQMTENYNGFKPELKPKDYYNRPAVTDQEADGSFTFKAVDKFDDKIIDLFRGYTGVTHETFTACGLTGVEEYSYTEKGYVHVYKTSTENPIFILKDTKTVIRPFAVRPYKKIECYGGELYHHGMEMIETAYLTQKERSDSDEGSNLPRAVLCYNFIDFVNLTAMEENALFLNIALNYDLREQLLGFVKEIVQIPGKSSFEASLSDRSAKNNIEVKTLDFNGQTFKEFVAPLGEDDLYKFKNKVNSALPLKFWHFETKKNIFEFNVIILRNMLTKFGYYTYRADFDDYIYIKIEGRIVRKMDKEIFPRHIEKFVDNYLLGRGETVHIRNKVSVSNRFNEKNLSGLQEINLDFDNSGADFQNWFFQDGMMWTASKNGITKKHQSMLKKYVWEEEVLNFSSEITDPPFVIGYSKEYKGMLERINTAANEEEKTRLLIEIGKLRTIDKYDIEIKDRKNYFLQYLFGTSYVYFEKSESKGYYAKPTDFWYKMNGILTEDEIKEIKLHVINKITWLGYYMKDFREPADDYGLAILDAVDDLPGNRKRGAAGGGKSLITRAIKEVKRTLIIKADREDFAEYAHRYENYNGERVIVCDDMNLKTRIGNMLTDFSNGIDKNMKHKRVIPVPFSRSPKIIITRNYIDDEGERVDRRLGRMFVFPFFHDEKSGRFSQRRKPSDWFGRMLYDSDTDEDRKRLINFFAWAYVANRNLGEIHPPMMDMDKFRLTKRIGEPLIEFLDNYFDDDYNFGYIDRVHLYQLFLENQRPAMSQYERTNVYNTSQKFKALVSDYCTLRNYEFNPDEFVNDREKGRIKRVSKIQVDGNGNGKNTEHFYIATKEKFIYDLKHEQPDAIYEPEKQQNIEFIQTDDIPF